MTVVFDPFPSGLRWEVALLSWLGNLSVSSILLLLMFHLLADFHATAHVLTALPSQYLQQFWLNTESETRRLVYSSSLLILEYQVERTHFQVYWVSFKKNVNNPCSVALLVACLRIT